MSSFADTLSIHERNVVEDLRIRMKNELPSEMYEDCCLLYRFLKARNFDVKKAEIMLKKHILWRKSYQVNTYLKEFKPKEVYCNYVKPNYIGLDKEGDIVLYSPTGKIDTRDVLKGIKMSDYKKHWIWYSELHSARRKQLKKDTGRELTRTVIIIDLDKLTFGNAANTYSAETFLILMHLMTDNDPECLKTCFVINAPSYYIIIFSIIKALISREMEQKIHVYGYDGWKAKFLEIIDEDVLPAFLGGKRTDPDGNPLCTTFMTHGGKIDPRYYLSDNERWFPEASKVKKIFVPQRSKKEICVDVRDNCSLIQWKFYVSRKDIGFGLFLKAPGQEELKDILPFQRFQTPDGTEEGSYRSRSAGKYIIIFDNSHSRLTPKEIEYCIEVTE